MWQGLFWLVIKAGLPEGKLRPRSDVLGACIWRIRWMPSRQREEHKRRPWERHRLALLKEEWKVSVSGAEGENHLQTRGGTWTEVRQADPDKGNGGDFVLLNSIGHEFPLKGFKLRSAIASFLFLRDHCGSGLLWDIFGWTVALPTKIGKRVGHGMSLCMLGVGFRHCVFASGTVNKVGRFMNSSGEMSGSEI